MLCVNRMLIMPVLAVLFVGACSPTAPRSLAPTAGAPSPAPITATVPAPAAPPATVLEPTPLPPTVPKPTPLPATVPAPTLPAVSGTAPAETDKTTSELVDFTSQALAGNLLGDPATRKIGIVLPPGYATSSERYPVVYFLHGYTGNELSGMSDFQWSIEDAHKTGGVRDMIMVFPDGSKQTGWESVPGQPDHGRL